jgi:hypothetical protein
MNTSVNYSYSILRYIHDVATGEFVNVGVALYSPQHNYFNVRLRTSVGRISEFFPDVRTEAFKTLMKGLSKRYIELKNLYSKPMNFGDKRTELIEILRSITPKDDSSLVWSDISVGLSSEPEITLERLYARYVTKYDHKKPQHHRTDNDVWRTFKKELSDRRLLDVFKEKIISGKNDEVKFPFAWKNGVWHCIEPISFDLSSSDSIREKAHRCLGQIASVRDTSEEFKLYLLISKPNEKSLANAFDRAVSILETMPIPTEIFQEDQSDVLADRFASQIGTHNLSSH